MSEAKAKAGESSAKSIVSEREWCMGDKPNTKVLELMIPPVQYVVGALRNVLRRRKGAWIKVPQIQLAISTGFTVVGKEMADDNHSAQEDCLSILTILEEIGMVKSRVIEPVRS